MLILWMVILRSCLIWLCLYSWTTVGNFATLLCRFWQKIIFSDEAHFDLGRYVNKQNCRIWGTENPHAYIKKSAYSKQVTVRCEFWSRGIIGPFFFEKWARIFHYSQRRSWHIERIFVYKNWRGDYWQQFFSTGRRYVTNQRQLTL